MSDDVMSAEEARAWRDDGVDGNREEIVRLCNTIIALHEQVGLNRAAWLNTREEMNELLDAEKERAARAEAERDELRAAVREYLAAQAEESALRVAPVPSEADARRARSTRRVEASNRARAALDTLHAVAPVEDYDDSNDCECVDCGAAVGVACRPGCVGIGP